MHARFPDGSAGDADYGKIADAYARYRRPEPRIAAAIQRHLGSAATVLNVGAGTGSYEPTDRHVTAVEPSASMRAQRPAHLAAAIDAVAERLPFPDKHFDAALALYTVHQWSDLRAGLAEMRRVARGPIVIMTCDPSLLDRYWLNLYAPDVIAAEGRRYPSIAAIADALGGVIGAHSVPIPLDCSDGFNEAYFGRPERLLEEGARLACSAWSYVEPAVADRFVAELGRDLADGTWDAGHGRLRTQAEYEGSLKLIVAR